MKKLISILAAVFAFGLIQAQNGSYSIEAVGSASPLTKENVRKMEDAAVTKDTTLPAPQFTYTLQTKRYQTDVQIDTIKAAKLGNEPVQKLYRTYARLGVGNYGTLLGELSVTSTRSKTGAWGVHLSHFGAGSGPKDVAGDFSGFNQQDVNLYGKRFLKKHVLYGAFDYDRDAVFNYGSVSPVNSYNKASSRQYYNYLAPSARLQSHLTDSASINHDIGLRYYHMKDRYDVKEDNILLDAKLYRYIRTEKLSVDAGIDYNRNASDADSVGNTIVNFKPMFSAHGRKMEVLAGIGISVEASPGEALWHFYPQFTFSYDIVNHIIIPYVKLGGYLERNSYRTLSLINPFILPSESFSLKNTQHRGDLAIGLRGQLGHDIVYDVSASRVELINAPFFVNTTFSRDLFQNKFAVVYDSATVANVHGQVAWQQFEKVRVYASGDWYQYKLNREAHAWHTPTLRLSLTGEYNVQDKIIGRLNVYYINGQYAKVQNDDGVTFSSVQLKGLVDVNLGFEYRYTKFLSVFLNVNNLASQRYNRWYAYPTQKFNVLGGLTYTF